MAPRNRRRSDQLHFAGSSNRFDNKRNSVPVIDPSPISKTFTRKIIYCKRCNNRVVSNVSHCPFCGKNLLPVYRRFTFWIFIVLLVAGAALAIVIFAPGINTEAPPAKEPTKPVTVGAAQGASIKDLNTGTTVDCDNLLVTMTETSGELKSINGAAITTVKVQFINKRSESVLLLLTQWQLEGANGVRVDSEPMKLEDGTDIKSDLDSTTLVAGATYSATLYFVADQPTKVVFAADPLEYIEEWLVTWALPAPAAEDADAGGDVDADAGGTAESGADSSGGAQ